MIKPFLRQVAEHYLKLGDLGDRIFVFPNRRSMAFFRMYLLQALKESGNGVIIAPKMMSVNDFFADMADKATADRITLLLKLYECYSKCQEAHGQKQEELDDFIYWGDTILADFNEVDKYHINAHSLFTNIRDFKEISYAPELTDEQKKAITQLAGHFSEEKWQKETGRLDVKENFLLVWEILGELYDSFRGALEAEGLAYEGMLYRSLADEITPGNAEEILHRAAPDAKTCVFVGLNALCKCEEMTLSAMTKAGLAEFCWDFSGEMVTDEKNPSSRFMRSTPFPNALKLDAEGLPKTKVHVINVPSANGQAKMLPDIISSVPEEERGIDFAVVLPDETMLLPVLGNIPESVKSINVTMGYGLSGSEWNALMRDIVAMQLHTRNSKYFYHRNVYDIFSNGVFKSLLSDEEKQAVADIQKAAKPYIPFEDLQKGEVLSLVFTQAGDDSAKLAAYLKEVAFSLGAKLNPDRKKVGTEVLLLECAMQYYRCVNRLADLKLNIRPKSFAHLLDQLVAGISVPFSGDPLGGLQVMGPLETRALDFKHIVLLNANDGVFPHKSVSSSFIPPELRKAFDLPGYEWQDAIWAYYFYRLISRAEHVWMIYDSRTDGLNSGEESCYIKQLRYLYGDKVDMDEYIASCAVEGSGLDDGIEKTDDDIKAMQEGEFSASSIEKYIHCPAQFYYYFIKKLYSKDEVEENLDSGMLGTICHDTMEALLCGVEAIDDRSNFDKRDKERKFNPLPELTQEYLDGWKSEAGQQKLRDKISWLICAKLKCQEVEGRDLVSAEMALSYVNKVIDRDLELIKEHGPIKVVGVEKEIHGEIAGHRFKGFIDRFDSLEEGTLRIVDYKSGRDRQRQLDPGSDKEKAAKLFLNIEGKPNPNASDYKAAFQFFIYDRLVQQKKEFSGNILRNSMYSISDVFTENVKIYPADPDYMDKMEENLKKVFAQMEDKSVKFTRNTRSCDFCDYKALCGIANKKK